MELNAWTHTEAVLAEYGEAVKEQYKESLRANKHPTTRNTLAGTAASEVVVEADGFEVVLRLQDYWKWVENDTRPHWPPRAPIDEWIQIKPVVPRPMANGKLPTPAQLSFLIRRKIAMKGTKGTHDFEDAVTVLEPTYLERISDAMTQDIREHVGAYLAAWDR